MRRGDRFGFFTDSDTANPNQASEPSTSSWNQPYTSDTGIFISNGSPTMNNNGPNEYDSGTDSDTVSSVGDTTYDVDDQT